MEGNCYKVLIRIMTAHTAGFSLDAHRRNTKNAIINVVRFIRGEEPENIVSLDSEY